MGWCSGTSVFDDVAKEILNSSLTVEDQEFVLSVLANALEDHDWDCQQDSRFWGKEPVQAVFRLLHPNWFKEEDDLCWQPEEE